ncbi:hypothetical protein CR513_36852, partial [Mucuna pruriens]
MHMFLICLVLMKEVLPFISHTCLHFQKDIEEEQKAKDNKNTKRSYNERKTKTPKGPIMRGRLRKLQEENLKVKLVTLEFSTYALVWWYQIIYDVRNMRRPHCETWADLKRELRDRFVSSYYARDLFVKLERLFKGSKSVKEYHEEIDGKDKEREKGLKRTRVRRRGVRYPKVEIYSLFHLPLVLKSQVVSSVLSDWEMAILLPNA